MAMDEPIISIAEYRRIMDDDVSTEEQILPRLQYLESLCRNVIRAELQKYEKASRNDS